MQIKINDQPLDFTLERDETLGEVVQELKSWLKGSDLVLYSVKHHDQDLLASPAEQWEGTTHREVDELAVTVRPAAELRLENLSTVIEYLVLLDRCLEGASDAGLAELTPGFAAMAESVARVAPGEPALQRLSSLIGDGAADSLGAWPQERVREAREAIGRLQALVRRRLGRYGDPRAAARELAAALAGFRGDAEGVAMLLQMGRDREAMDAIIRFSDLLQEVGRVLHALGATERTLPALGGLSMRQFYTDMNGFLTELLEAFTAQDSVLIGDLMEYEVAPRLEQLGAALGEIA
jgi:hypothetical protein